LYAEITLDLCTTKADEGDLKKGKQAFMKQSKCDYNLKTNSKSYSNYSAGWIRPST
jgi:hypothetical protein